MPTTVVEVDRLEAGQRSGADGHALGPGNLAEEHGETPLGLGEHRVVGVAQVDGQHRRGPRRR